MATSLRILFFGDVIGSAGRKGLAEFLPRWRREHKPDIIIANAENIAHGHGITRATIKETQAAGVDFFTSGNHIWAKREGTDILRDPDPIVIRPANYPTDIGLGEKILTVGEKRLLVLNLLGRVFLHEDCDDPFRALDRILAKYAGEKLDGILVDFHAEATSEKVAFGWYADGRVSAVLGTHTHVPTADARILPRGTAFLSDVGMVGPTESVIGVRTEQVIERFLTQMPVRFEVVEAGPVAVNAVLVDIDPATAHARTITPLHGQCTV